MYLDLQVNWHPFEGPGLQDHDLFLFYGLLLCFCVVVYLFVFVGRVSMLLWFLVGNFWDVNGTGIMKQANAVTYNGN